MDPTTVTAAASAVTAALAAAGFAARKAGILQALVRMHDDRRRVAIAREQRHVVVHALSKLPAGSTLTHATADGELTVRFKVAIGGRGRDGAAS